MNASVLALKLNYPSFQVGGRPLGMGAEAVWQGWVQPIRSLEDWSLLVADLAQNRPVRVLPGGEVLHQPNCRRKHPALPWLKQLKKPDKAFKLKIAYGGGIRHPRAFVIKPKIPPEECRHMFGDGAICAYPPWQNVWDWQRNTVAEFADQAAIWLIKWNVWQQTGVWLGDEIRHDKGFLFFNLKADEQCWCGTGKRYDNCHQASDGRSALRSLFPFYQKLKNG